MGGRRNEASAGILQRETDRVIEGTCGDFVIADKAGENGEAGGVGARPGVRTLLVGEKIPDGAGIGVPAGGLRIGAVEFIEEAVGLIENQDVTIAGAGIGIALDGIGECDGHGARVALAAIGLVINGDEGLGGVDDRVGDAHVGTVVLASAEIGMEANRGTHVIDEGSGVRINRRGRNIFVPEIVRGEGDETAEAAALAGRHLRTIGCLDGAVHLKIQRGGSGTAGIGIFYRDGEGAGGRGVAGGGQLRCRNEGGGESVAAEKDLRAGDELTAGNGEREIAEIGSGRRDARERWSRVEKSDSAGRGFGGVGGTGGRDGDSV